MPDNPCPLHGPLTAQLDRIEGKTDSILARMGKGDTEFAVQSVEIIALKEDTRFLKSALFGVAIVVILAVIGAVLKLVLNG